MAALSCTLAAFVASSLRSYADLLLFYRDEIRALDEFRTDTEWVTPQKLELARLLVESLDLAVLPQAAPLEQRKSEPGRFYVAPASAVSARTAKITSSRFCTMRSEERRVGIHC